jgi:hypothetical protein
MKKDIFEERPERPMGGYPGDIPSNQHKGDAMGFNMGKKDVGGRHSGQIVAKGLDNISQGKQVSGEVLKSLEPYANILNDIFSNTKYRQRFLQLVRQMHQEMKPQAESVNEAMSDAYGVIGAEPEVEGSVEFKQHKNTDKGSVSIEASGDDMQELARVLKLAGLTLPKDMNPEETDAEEVCDDCGKPGSECDCPGHDHGDEECDTCADDEPEVKVLTPNAQPISDLDAAYTTDKETLVNVLKDKLKKSLS